MPSFPEAVDLVCRWRGLTRIKAAVAIVHAIEAGTVFICPPDNPDLVLGHRPHDRGIVVWRKDGLWLDRLYFIRRERALYDSNHDFADLKDLVVGEVGLANAFLPKEAETPAPGPEPGSPSVLPRTFPEDMSGPAKQIALILWEKHPEGRWAGVKTMMKDPSLAGLKFGERYFESALAFLAGADPKWRFRKGLRVSSAK
jgi:hypothetical protein